MVRPKLLICNCPDLRVDAQALADRLGHEGVQARLAPPLCTPAGLEDLRKFLGLPGAGEWLIGACGPEVNAGLFQLLAGDQVLTVVDLLACGEVETALGEIGSALDPAANLTPRPAPVSGEVLIIGGGIGGCQAALDLANAGFKVYLAETSLSIGGAMAQLDKTFPTLDCSICILGPKLAEVATNKNIELLTYARLDRIAGEAGNFEVDLTIRPRYVHAGKCVGCGTCATVCPVIVPSRRFLPYCSGYCCTASIKEAMLALEHDPEIEITIFYNDIRTSGKGSEELYRRAQKAGVRFVKGLPGRIEEDESGGPVVVYEDRLRGGRARLAVDLAVLAAGLEGRREPLPFAGPRPAQDAWGFYQGRHPVLQPLESTTPGVFWPGPARDPRTSRKPSARGAASPPGSWDCWPN